MKFTDGYWQIKKGIEPIYAVEYYGHEQNGSALTVYVATNHISNRGDVLNKALLTVTIDSPIENVIHVSAVHFKGSVNRGPRFNVYGDHNDTYITVKETDEKLVFTSGNSHAVISKLPHKWGIEFLDGDRLITSSGFRNLAYMKDTLSEKNYMTEQLLLDIGETVYGFGECFTPFVKNGQPIDMWNADGGTASQQTYKSIPFYLSSKGYGVFVSNPGEVSYEVAAEKVQRVCFSVNEESLEYYIINGHTPKGSVALYTCLTGKPALPPAWSFGLWLSTSFTTNYDEKTVTSFIDGMAERDIPLSTFHFDCFWMKEYEWSNFTWDERTFPDPKAMLGRLKERGLKISAWINPYIAQKSPLFDEGFKNGYLIKKTNGDVWQTDMWQAGMAIVDFTNPKAAEWYRSKLKIILDMGVDCLKTDFGERIPVKDIVYFDGSDPIKMHNYYTYLYNQAVYTLIEEKYGKGNAVVFARSATAGGQQFPVHWGGDCEATFYSMAEEIRGGLSLASCGFGFWSHDIGGFEQTASATVYKRWCAFGLLSSHSRLHGSDSYRVPWLYDEEAVDVLRKFVRLKLSFMPYLYAQAVIAHTQGIPMLRPMFMEFPDDPGCKYIDTQYMLGDSLLIAPVLKESGEVTYYLPKGNWTNYLTNEVKEGEKWYTEIFDVFHLPLMVRENTILPIGSCDDRPDYDFTKDVALKLYQFEEGKEAAIFIPDLNGNELMRIQASKVNGEIKLDTKGGSVGKVSCY